MTRWSLLLQTPSSFLHHFLGLYCKDNGPHTARNKDGFALKQSVAELFELFDREQSLSIQELVINDGLPVRMTVADTIQP